MKKLVILFLVIGLSASIQAAVSKTVNVSTAGTLHTYFTAGEKTTVTDLTVTGTIDVRDFKFMRDTLSALAKVNLSTVTIAEYLGTAGTSTGLNDYPANAIPFKAFDGKSTLVSIILPNSLKEIDDFAFRLCPGLTSIIIPVGVTKVLSNLFYADVNLKNIQFNNPTPTNLSLIGNGDGETVLGMSGTNCNIYVPVGSTGGYNDGVWNLRSYNSYTVIGGQIPTGIKTASISKITISKQGETATISGLTVGETLTVYTLQGAAIYNQAVNAETVTVSLPAHGVYIVKVGEQTTKVIL